MFGNRDHTVLDLITPSQLRAVDPLLVIAGH